MYRTLSEAPPEEEKTEDAEGEEQGEGEEEEKEAPQEKKQIVLKKKHLKEFKAENYRRAQAGEDPLKEEDFFTWKATGGKMDRKKSTADDEEDQPKKKTKPHLSTKANYKRILNQTE